MVGKEHPKQEHLGLSREDRGGILPKRVRWGALPPEDAREGISLCPSASTDARC